jgi:uncharacterized protein (TIGR02266 family)
MDFDTILFIVVAIIVAGGIVYYVVSLSKSSDRPSIDIRFSAKPPQRIGAERRQYPRIDINWPVSIETPEGTIDAEIKNISLGGAFIGCKKPFPVGQFFSLTMTPPNSEPVTASAEVVWSNANVPEDKIINRGMGVRFIKMSERHLQMVRQLFPKIDSLTI